MLWHTVVTSALLPAAQKVRRSRRVCARALLGVPRAHHRAASSSRPPKPTRARKHAPRTLTRTARIQQMAAAGLDALRALDKKANELLKKAHYARAAEKLDAAVLAAKALGYADCLITATLEIEAAGIWCSHASAPGVLEADCDAAMENALRYFRRALQVLERRKAAGTLQPYKCRPAEEVWSATRARYSTAEIGNCLAPFVGYQAFLLAASFKMDIYDFTNPDFHSQSELQSFVVSAMDLVLEPRENFDCPIPGEIAFVHSLQRRYDEIVSTAAAPRFQALLDAWCRLERSGLFSLHSRGLGLMLSVSRRGTETMTAAANAKHASAVLHTCALETCTACEVHESQFKRCGACRLVVYCCKEHQTADWPSHKAACKAARKAAAPDST